VVKNPNIVAVRFIGPFNKTGFINETSTKNHFITSLLAKKNLIEYENRDFTQKEALDIIKLVDRFYRWVKDRLPEPG